MNLTATLSLTEAAALIADSRGYDKVIIETSVTRNDLFSPETIREGMRAADQWAAR